MIGNILRVVQGWMRIKGNTDGTFIGNTGDSLKTDVTASALPTGASTAANQSTGNASLSSIDTKLTDNATATNQTTINTSIQAVETDIEAGNVLTGAVTETAPATDTASSGLNGRLQRIAQRISTFITGLTNGSYQILLRGNTDGTNIGNVSDALKINDQTLGATNVLDTNNSTSTALGVDGVFTGTATEILSYSTVSVIVFSDQASALDGLDIQLSTDSTNWDESLPFNVEAGVTRRFNIPCNARYFRVVYTNGGVAQTAFRLQTILHSVDIGRPVIRISDDISPDRSANLMKSVLAGNTPDNGYVNILATNEGRLKSDTQITDPDGSQAAVTNFSELRVANRFVDVEAKFYYNINTRTIATDHLNGGSATVTNRQAVLSTSTATNGRAFVRSVETIDYRVSQALEASSTFRFPAVTGTVGTQVGPANCKQVIGVIDESENDYIVWGFENGSRFFIEYANGGTATRVLATAFNRDRLDGSSIVNDQVSQYTPDWTQLQIIRVIYSWHGVVPFVFQIQKPSGDWRTFHIETFINTNTTPSIGTPILPIGALNENNGSTTNNQLIWQAGQISYLGENTENASARFFEANFDDNVTAEEPILTIRNKTTYASLTNFIALELDYISLSSNGNREVKFRVYRNGTLTGASFADVDATNSVVELDTAATAFTPAGDPEIVFKLGPAEAINEIIRDLELRLQPGDSFTITGESTQANDTTTFVRWRELH